MAENCSAKIALSKNILAAKCKGNTKYLLPKKNPTGIVFAKRFLTEYSQRDFQKITNLFNLLSKTFLGFIFKNRGLFIRNQLISRTLGGRVRRDCTVSVVRPKKRE